ncbi:hypothetical protein DICVIV_05277 [Dictyocaulus viviparus]|uniref:Methyltransferase FkbM domain-containing protein n=1 Tax=Dictyocaulus viviparus TaxID=29172 RepID=A0A0D8XVP6_DICVI|nr:hypothetical protein DICVIV_05277 [Dictyocaulus viviparus]
MTARHLALTINVESTGGDDATRVIGEWYQLLYWLFYSEGYALIGATSSGICGRKNQNCRYYVSLMRLESMELRTRVMAPVFGLGSPKEEQKRLINFLHASACRTVSKTNFPTYCQKDFYRNNTVILVSYRHLEQSDIPPSLSGLPNFHVITPIKSTKSYRHLEQSDIPPSLSGLPNFHVITPIKSTKSLNATVHRIGIGPEYMKQTIDGEWKLDTLKNLLNKIAHGTIIDLIIIDLDGGEIDSYDEILQLARSSRFLQLSVRGRIWPEENENYRQTYWNLRQMQNYGYSMQFANVNLSFYDVVFVKK